MRRAIANSVLLITLGIFFAPALTAFVTPPLPACCRRGGAHHCAGLAAMMPAEGTSLRTNNPCPMRQGPQLGSSIIALLGSRTLHIGLQRELLISRAVSGERAPAILIHRGRSPPVLA